MIITSTGFDPYEGWLGNKFFKYCTLICLSKEFNCEIHLDSWMGDAIFNLNRVKKTPDSNDIDVKISEGRDPNTPNTYVQTHSFIINYLRQNSNEGKVWDIAYNSNTFYHTSYYNEHKSEIINQFIFKEKISKFFDEEIKKFKSNNNLEELFVCNLRLGEDYSKKWKFPETSLINLLEEQNVKNKKIIVCTDDKDKAREVLKDYDVLFFKTERNFDFEALLKEANFNVDLPKYGGNFSFLADYFIMTKADKLVCSDSTFAYSAAMLNKNENCIFFKYNIGNKKFNVFNPWSTWLMDMRTHRFNNLDKDYI